ncbi:MAG: hypothetical protein ACKOHI_11680, partial [Phycisphaerales bacterium]
MAAATTMGTKLAAWMLAHSMIHRRGEPILAMPTWWLFAVASVYWATNLGAGPAWNTWVGALFPRRVRVRYFGWRSRLYQVAIMGSLLL